MDPDLLLPPLCFVRTGLVPPLPLGSGGPQTSSPWNLDLLLLLCAPCVESSLIPPSTWTGPFYLCTCDVRPPVPRRTFFAWFSRCLLRRRFSVCLFAAVLPSTRRVHSILLSMSGSHRACGTLAFWVGGLRLDVTHCGSSDSGRLPCAFSYSALLLDLRSSVPSAPVATPWLLLSAAMLAALPSGLVSGLTPGPGLSLCHREGPPVSCRVLETWAV